MFTETIASPAGAATGSVSESHALILLRRSCRRGYAIEPLRNGGAVIRYRRASLTATAPVQNTITLTPHEPAEPTDLDLSNLRYIDAVKIARFTGSDRYALPVVLAGTYEIPPGQAERLSRQSFLADAADGTLRLTLAARLTLLAASHARMDAGDRTTAWCSCGLAVHGKPERVDAVLISHLAAVTDEFLDSLDPAFTAAVTSA
ncbi:hypothetical protein ABZ499_32920 [Streptomyces sp. NPDC019990]|uniref:hypothetical protein n=1 Tax=Streptomyces sp. NPDC019990 TaxID=3154693 RepID=UPI0033F5E314